jgi:hypothetical protein
MVQMYVIGLIITIKNNYNDDDDDDNDLMLLPLPQDSQTDPRLYLQLFAGEEKHPDGIANFTA